MAAAHILQVAYYDTLRELRVKMLEAAGYQVTSVSGNDNAIGLDGAAIAGANLIVVGFSAEHSGRLPRLVGSKCTTPKIQTFSCRSTAGSSSLSTAWPTSAKTPRTCRQ